jgi:predicted permease
MTVGPRFFETLRQPLVAGREFAREDTDSSRPVAILNRSFARRLFGETNPVGRRLALGSGEASIVEIVGVAADAVHTAPRARAPRTLYYPAAQNSRRLRWLCLAIRTDGDPTRVASEVRQELRAIDPTLPVMKVDTLDEQLDAVLFQDRLITNLALTFGVLAAVLSGAGLCAMLFYAIARRTKEIGVRVALGASHRAVLRIVLGETVALVLGGLALGLPLTLIATRTMAGRLFGIAPNDPLTILVAAVTICATSITAAAAPARRATRVDPMIALRCD